MEDEYEDEPMEDEYGDEPFTFKYNYLAILEGLIREDFPALDEPTMELASSILKGLLTDPAEAATPRHVQIAQAVATAKITLGL